jgi:hypothetical protein
MTARSHNRSRDQENERNKAVLYMRNRRQHIVRPNVARAADRPLAAADDA